jgi:hypothetical protein
VTKSGTNTVKGSVYYVFRNDSLAGDRYNNATDTYTAPAPFKETTKGATVGGPLIKDKLFIFAAYEKLESTRTAPSFGPIGSSSPTSASRRRPSPRPPRSPRTPTASTPATAA